MSQIAMAPLLCPLKPFPAAEALVCHCFQVDQASIRKAIHETGAATVDQVTRETGAGGGCQGCHCRIQRLLAGLPLTCSPYSLCQGCGTIKKLCACEAA